MKSTGEPRCSESEQVRFGGRPSEKGHFGTSLAAHPTARRVRRAARGNGPGAIPAPRPVPTQRSSGLTQPRCFGGTSCVAHDDKRVSLLDGFAAAAEGRYAPPDGDGPGASRSARQGVRGGGLPGQPLCPRPGRPGYPRVPRYGHDLGPKGHASHREHVGATDGERPSPTTWAPPP